MSTIRFSLWSKKKYFETTWIYMHVLPFWLLLLHFFMFVFVSFICYRKGRWTLGINGLWLKLWWCSLSSSYHHVSPFMHTAVLLILLLYFTFTRGEELLLFFTLSSVKSIFFMHVLASHAAILLRPFMFSWTPSNPAMHGCTWPLFYVYKEKNIRVDSPSWLLLSFVKICTVLYALWAIFFSFPLHQTVV